MPGWWHLLHVNDPRWVVLRDGDPVGVAAAPSLPWRASREPPLRGVAPVVSNALLEVAKPHRGAGVGAAALQAMAAGATRSRLPPLIAAVEPSNTAARRCAEAAGMEYVGESEAGLRIYVMAAGADPPDRLG